MPNKVKTINELDNIVSVLFDALKLLKEQPQIVRCKDCKNGELYHSGDEPYGIVCDGVWHDGDWFCADGERAE